MATRRGYGGAVTIPAGFGTPTNLRVYEWAMDETREPVDDNKFGNYTSDIEVCGGMTRRVITLRARADKVDHPKLMTLTSAISDQLDEPIANLQLWEGYAGAGQTGDAPNAYHKLSALVTGCRINCVRVGGVDYDLTFTGSGAKSVSS